MRNPLRRFYGRGDLHFITFSFYRRRRYLGTHRARDRFVKILDQVRSAIQIPADRLRGDTRTCASTGQRTKEGQSLESAAGAQTKSFSCLAQTGEKAVRPAIAGFRCSHG